MNHLNILIKTLSIVIEADKSLTSGAALYQVKSLFDSLLLDDAIDFNSEYGELLRVVLDTKRKDTAAKNIIFARSLLQSLIREQEQVVLKAKEEEEVLNALAIDSTCEVVSPAKLENKVKKIGRPKIDKPLTSAERSKRSRDKKRASNVITVNTSLTVEASKLYSQLIESGYDINSIIEMAYNQAPLSPSINRVT